MNSDLIYKVFWAVKQSGNSAQKWTTLKEWKTVEVGSIKVSAQGFSPDADSEQEFDLIFTVKDEGVDRHFRLRCWTDSFGNVSDLSSSRNQFCEVKAQPIRTVEYVPI